ncbi:alpha/beta hydrolase [Microbacterium atlanticum]|uniref:alpha/beta hydrolase n=1 Tax=Microbacterium atlanticum TaxID=2782168 RepID=UPI0018899608|nr:alpha/beta hydrolase-fold protein [Microbacterium atlanticum]
MSVLTRRDRAVEGSQGGSGRGRHARLVRPFAALGLSAALVLSTVPLAAQAEDSPLTPGPTVYADPNSPTGYTGRFVYYNPDATSVRFVADILLRNWADPSDTTVYQPSQYKPGLMRGGGGYDVQMTDAGGGYWVTEVPLAAGANQYWFYVNNNTNAWLADPANSPIFAPDGIAFPQRRAFNKVFVPYDEAKQNFAPLAARQIELPREDSEKGTWSYVPIDIPNQTGRTLGVYLPPDYDPDRAEPYKTIYMQHGGGQDQSDWLNMGNVPVIMDNLLDDGTTEPAVVIMTNTNYLGPVGNQAVLGDAYPNLRNVVIPFVEANYNVSTEPIDRAFAGLSAGSIVTQNLIRDDVDLFAYWGPWSGGVSVPLSTANLAAPYIHYGGGAWDFGLPNANTVAALDNVGFIENTVVAGAHDFNAWNQLFSIFARDYLWHPEAFLKDEIDTLKSGVAAAGLNKGNTTALTVKLDQALKLVTKDDTDGALEVLGGFLTQVAEFQSAGKLTAEQAAGLTTIGQKVTFNLGYWQQ